MNDDLAILTPVLTRKPAHESSHWTDEDKSARRWHTRGKVQQVDLLDRSDPHRLVYTVLLEDGSVGRYERRELVRADRTEYTVSEKREMIDKMDATASAFYSTAIRTGVHAFIEFAGLMNEFVLVCRDALRQGIDFPNANTHSGVPMPFLPQHAAYIAEKLSCIYGPALLGRKEMRDTFVAVLFDGKFVLQPSERAVAKQQVTP